MVEERMKKKFLKTSANTSEGDTLKSIHKQKVTKIEVESQNEGTHYVNELANQNKALKKINQFALELSVLSSEENLDVFITRRIKEFAGAKTVTFAEYNPSTRTITPRHIEIESGLLEKIVDLLGTQIQNIHSVVSNELYKEMTTEIVGVFKTLYEASFGVVPRPVGTAIEMILNIDRIIGVVYLIEGKLFGTSLLGMEKGKPDPPRELLENFAHLAATSLRRRNSEAELKESEAKYRFIVENIGEGFAFVNADEEFLISNSAAEKIFGVNKGGLKGKNVKEFLSEEQIILLESQTRIMKKGQSSSYELEITCPDGYKKNIILTVVPEFDLKKNYLGAHGIFRDITERKKWESALQESEKQLLRLNADKDKFFSIIAHDLRSPFNLFLGYTQKMSKELDSMTTKEIHRVSLLMNKSATDLYNLLNNLLNWTRIKQGLIPFRPQKTVLSEICRDAVDILNQNADAKNILIHNRVNPDLVIYADTEMLKVVLRNLVSNAIKFTNKGGTININAEQQSSSVIVSVSDNGVGIPQANLARLFEISDIQSVKGTANEKGSGLGLLLCKEFVEKHNGSLIIKSEVGKGTECIVTFPNEPNKN